ETKYLYAPLAHRLGLYAIKSELEDLYLKFMDADTYNFIVQKISETRVSRNKFIKRFIAPLENELNQQKFKYSIKGRRKYNNFIKNMKHNLTIPFVSVNHLCGVQTILYTPLENVEADCCQVCSIVTEYNRPNLDLLRDRIRTPRATGYDPLHTPVMRNTAQ